MPRAKIKNSGYQLTEEDKDLFREAVKHLRFSTPQAKSKKQSKTIPAPIDLYDPTYQTILPTDTLFYSRGGLQNKALKDLKTGKINIQAELDLHGFTIETAREAVRNFIYTSHTKHLKYIRIIHGKGNILKNHVNSWLQQFDFVLAFASAVPKHGGTGAVCVILKS